MSMWWHNSLWNAQNNNNNRKKPWFHPTVRHPQQASCHNNVATRDGGMSGRGSEPAVLRGLYVSGQGGCSTFNKTPPHGHKTKGPNSIRITLMDHPMGWLEGMLGGQRQGEAKCQRCFCTPLGVCWLLHKHSDEITALILNVCPTRGESSHGNNVMAYFLSHNEQIFFFTAKIRSSGRKRLLLHI